MTVLGYFVGVQDFTWHRFPPFWTSVSTPHKVLLSDWGIYPSCIFSSPPCSVRVRSGWVVDFLFEIRRVGPLGVKGEKSYSYRIYEVSQCLSVGGGVLLKTRYPWVLRVQVL